jgi:hypothetical protein
MPSDKEIVTKFRITPFLLINPLIALWGIYCIVVLQMSGGFAVIMTGFYITIVAVSLGLLIVDRLLPRQINIWFLYIVEVLILIASYQLAEWYWHNGG